jgi:hypothetical protein
MTTRGWPDWPFGPGYEPADRDARAALRLANHIFVRARVLELQEDPDDEQKLRGWVRRVVKAAAGLADPREPVADNLVRERFLAFVAAQGDLGHYMRTAGGRVDDDLDGVLAGYAIDFLSMEAPDYEGRLRKHVGLVTELVRSYTRPNPRGRGKRAPVSRSDLVERLCVAMKWTTSPEARKKARQRARKIPPR